MFAWVGGLGDWVSRGCGVRVGSADSGSARRDGGVAAVVRSLTRYGIQEGSVGARDV